MSTAKRLLLVITIWLVAIAVVIVFLHHDLHFWARWITVTGPLALAYFFTFLIIMESKQNSSKK